MVETKLYEAKVGGAMYWVSALHRNHAFEILMAEGESTGSDAEDFEEADIYECLPERAEKLRYTSCDDEHRSMWGEFLRGRAPRIIACSEY